MELIKIENNKIGSESIDTVDARELHYFLESKQQFSNWIQKRIEDYDFIEGADFATINKKVYRQTLTEYHITIDMAKELAMVERNEKGKEARKFFIERDKNLSQIESQKLPDFTDPATAAEAWAIEFREKTKAQLELKEAQPKIEFANHIEISKDSISVADFAKLLHKKGVKLGQNRMFTYFYDQKYLMSSTSPYQKWVDQGLFEIKEIPYINGRKEEKVAQKVMVTGKGQTYLTKKICNSFQIEQPSNSQTQF